MLHKSLQPPYLYKGFRQIFTFKFAHGLGLVRKFWKIDPHICILIAQTTFFLECAVSISWRMLLIVAPTYQYYSLGRDGIEIPWERKFRKFVTLRCIFRPPFFSIFAVSISWSMELNWKIELITYLCIGLGQRGDGEGPSPSSLHSFICGEQFVNYQHLHLFKIDRQVDVYFITTLRLACFVFKFKL